MPIINRPFSCSFLALVLISLSASATTNDTFPTRPIRLISPFAPGGGNDIISRTLGAAVSRNIVQSIVVDNRPGANTIVAMEIQHRAVGVAALESSKAGRLHALAVTSGTRSSLAPQLPTVAESGIPGYDASTWYGIIAPAGTPRAVIVRLNSEMTAVLTTPEFREQLMNAGADPAPNTPEQFAALIQSEIAKWAKVIKLSGAKAEAM